MWSVFTMFQCVPIAMMLTFIVQQSHLLMSLLALEGITLSLVLFVPLLLSASALPLPIICIIFLTLGACEASMGLALMVLMTRTTGNDMVKSLSLNKC